MSKIPHDFHFVFGLRPQTAPFHIMHYLCLQSCIQVNRPRCITLHYVHEPFGPWWEKIVPQLRLQRVKSESFINEHPAYRLTQEGRFIERHGLVYAHEADFLRLKILLEHGGVYADMDTLFLNPLPEDLFNKDFVLGREGPVAPGGGEEPEDSLCNAFIMSTPGAAFGTRWLSEMYRVFDGTWSRHSCIEAGRLQRSMPHAVHVCPQHFFYKYPFTREGIHAMLLGRNEDYSGMYSMHLWAHLWWDRNRRDFSDFHGSLMTEWFIRNVDTTYTVAARRFLE